MQATKQVIDICDLCGSTESENILSSKKLDGPLVKCCKCDLIYVKLEQRLISDSKAVVDEMDRLADRAAELQLVEPEVESSESPWREVTAKERMDDILRIYNGRVYNGRSDSGGDDKRLLEIGSSTGEMLAAAASYFDATGIEADRRTSRKAQAKGLNCINGTLKGAAFPDKTFDVVALYHVIEHFHSPRCEIVEMQRILKSDGLLCVEAPNIATIWYRILKSRWRQFIPDHIFFFTPDTITELLKSNGFEIIEIRSVGKSMSLRLFLDRLRRFNKYLGGALIKVSDALHLNDISIRLNLGDVMRVYARKK